MESFAGFWVPYWVAKMAWKKAPAPVPQQRGGGKKQLAAVLIQFIHTPQVQGGSCWLWVCGGYWLVAAAAPLLRWGKGYQAHDGADSCSSYVGLPQVHDSPTGIFPNSLNDPSIHGSIEETYKIYYPVNPKFHYTHMESLLSDEESQASIFKNQRLDLKFNLVHQGLLPVLLPEQAFLQGKKFPPVARQNLSIQSQIFNTHENKKAIWKVSAKI